MGHLLGVEAFLSYAFHKGGFAEMYLHNGGKKLHTCSWYDALVAAYWQGRIEWNSSNTLSI